MIVSDFLTQLKCTQQSPEEIQWRGESSLTVQIGWKVPEAQNKRAGADLRLLQSKACVLGPTELKQPALVFQQLVEKLTTLAHPLPVLSLGEDRAFLWSNPFPLSPRAYWRATTCGLEPNSLAALRPHDARERPCVDVGLVDRKHAQRQGRGAGRVRARGRASTKASGHVVSIATAEPAAKLPQPQRTPQGQRSSLWQHKLPALRQLRQTASAALRCGAPGTPRRGARVVAGPGGSGGGSHPKEDRAWPSHPSSQGSVRPTPNPAWTRSPRGPTPGRRAEPQRWPALGLQKTNDHKCSGKLRLCPPPCILPDFAPDTNANSVPPSPRPRRPSALHL